MMTNKYDIELVATAIESGDYATDCRRGRDMADRFIADMGSPVSLGFLVRRLVARETFNAVHIGFMQRFAEQVLCMRATSDA